MPWRSGCAAAGLEFVMHKSIAPASGPDGKITVSLWLARDRRIPAAEPGAREVA